MTRKNPWLHRLLSVAAGTALISGLAGSAVAAPTTGQQAAAACAAYTMSFTAGGDHLQRDFQATKPPSKIFEITGATGAFPQTRLSGAMLAEPVDSGTLFSGWAVSGDSMYEIGYAADQERKLVPGTLLKKRVGGGWNAFTEFETARYYESTAPTAYRRINQYALRSDGTLFRWTVSGDAWTKPVSAPGFASVRTMALISQTRTYETFVATTKGGSLYTVHLPTDATMKPVVKQISAPQNGWQSYIDLIAQRCGQYGTLLLAIDRNARNGKLFAVGRANGMATVINDLGWIGNDSFPDPVNFGWVSGLGVNPPPNGE
ncbi:hypothetical protein AB0P21_08460 [Kribbella sp. NPDC056861]|uniref:hypothetical protein n=1 Tax=Kribbella sp. NPDC056861 TaxID=3154857 RepID=UPI003438E0C2